MAISITSINSPPSSSISSVVGNASTPFVNGAQSSISRQTSAVVTLSAQGQQLSQSQASNQTGQAQASQSQASNAANTAANENVEPKSKETSEAPGIQLVEGESKGGRINTFA